VYLVVKFEQVVVFTGVLIPIIACAHRWVSFCIIIKYGHHHCHIISFMIEIDNIESYSLYHIWKLFCFYFL